MTATPGRDGKGSAIRTLAYDLSRLLGGGAPLAIVLQARGLIQTDSIGSRESNPVSLLVLKPELASHHLIVVP